MSSSVASTLTPSVPRWKLTPTLRCAWRKPSCLLWGRPARLPTSPAAWVFMTTGGVIGNGTHAAGDVGNLAGLPHKMHEGFRHAQRCVGVKFHPGPDGGKVDGTD